MEKRSEKLKLDPITGELTVTRLPMKNYDNVTHNDIAEAGFFGGNFAAPAEEDNLLIFPTLTKLPIANSSDNLLNSNVAREVSFGGSFVAPPDKDNIVITPQSYGKEEVSVETMHISCQSDIYQPGYNYGGVIIYQYDSKNAFGESVNDAEVVGEGFAIRNDKLFETFEINSSVFNNPPGSHFTMIAEGCMNYQSIASER
ncbi:Hypothetical predicted protein [Paramuricea clavata]|uniref:Uncharacterized protein n=1 Tax=Paramuricea clavata TaxID=317549 RepID=A0A7D9JXX0_PARCT|nr:Hypothetical predicted protein [Paramuricea clavata]